MALINPTGLTHLGMEFIINGKLIIPIIKLHLQGEINLYFNILKILSVLLHNTLAQRA